MPIIESEGYRDTFRMRIILFRVCFSLGSFRSGQVVYPAVYA